MHTNLSGNAVSPESFWQGLLYVLLRAVQYYYSSTGVLN